MQTWSLAIFLSLCLLLGNCTPREVQYSLPSKETPQKMYLWTETEIEFQAKACRDGYIGEDVNDANVVATATVFCRCIYEKAAQRWTFEDYLAHVDACEEIISKDFDKTCSEMAKR